MALIRVTAEKIRQEATKLRNQNQQFKTAVGNLESTEAALNSQWDGDANDAFHKAFQNDKTQMDNFYRLIEEYCKALETIAQKYDQEEKKNVDVANKRSYK